MITRTVWTTSALLVLSGASPALAGDVQTPFELLLRASASVTGDNPTVQTSTVGPVTNQASDAGGSARASTDYTHLGVFSDYGPPTTFATATASATDQLTITAPGAPGGTTRLELTWRLTGSLAGDGNVSFSSSFGLDTAFNPATPAQGRFNANTPGVIDELVNFTYDNVPIGAPWNLGTSLRIGGANASGTADFIDSATLQNATLFVDDVSVPAGVTGLGGAVYAAILAGDYNASGQVEQGDLDLVLQNWGVDTDTAGVPVGWSNDLPSGQIE